MTAGEVSDFPAFVNDVTFEDNTSVESTAGDVTLRAGDDVVGRLLDPEGVPLGPAFQVNLTSTDGNETGPQLVALPDGGFVMAYGGFKTLVAA